MGEDISNKFLGIEIMIPFILLAIGGLISWGSLSADMDHKADKAAVEVLTQKVEDIADDVEENKEAVKELNDIARANQTILLRIEKQIQNDDG